MILNAVNALGSAQSVPEANAPWKLMYNPYVVGDSNSAPSVDQRPAYVVMVVMVAAFVVITTGPVTMVFTVVAMEVIVAVAVVVAVAVTVIT